MIADNEYGSFMSVFMSYILPLVVIGVTFALKPLRHWLENCAKESVNQSELVESYRQNVSRFLRLSDPEKHREMREIVVWAGRNMLNGTMLIRLILLNGRRRSDTDAEMHSSVEASVAGLSDEAVHAFGRALGAALLVSSFQAVFMGRAYRSMLLWLLKSPDKEVKEPEQIVYRYRRATSMDHKRRLTFAA